MFGIELTSVQKIWMGIGFLGQALFTARLFAQWLASERAGRSTVPTSYWWFSLAGSSLILAYALYRVDPVIIVGQIAGPLIYSRNLALIARAQTGAAKPAAHAVRRAA